MPEIRRFESVAAWQARARELFGDDPGNWRFVCPVCGNVAAVREFKEAGAPDADSARCECLGRHLPKERTREAFGEGKVERPCNYAGYGLIQLSPVRVVVEGGKEIHSFAFDGDLDGA